MYPVERDTGTCVFPTKGIPAAGASPEASRLNKAIRTMDRRIWSWGGGCATTGNDGVLYPVGYASKKVNLTEANTREGMPGGSGLRGLSCTWLAEDLRSRMTTSS